MNFEQLHIALSDSAKSGEIRKIVQSFIDSESVLTAKTLKYAQAWLNYSPKNADVLENGELPTFSDMMQAAVNGYCHEFINVNYKGCLPVGFDALKFLSEFEDEKFYSSAAELDASGEIYSALNNDGYYSLAIDAIYLENWKAI